MVEWARKNSSNAKVSRLDGREEAEIRPLKEEN